MSTSRHCAICGRWLSPDWLGDYCLGRSLKRKDTTLMLSRDLWLCEDCGREVVRAIRAQARVRVETEAAG